MRNLRWTTAGISLWMLIACASNPPSDATNSPLHPPPTTAPAGSSEPPPAPPEEWSDSKDVLGLDGSVRQEMFLEPTTGFELSVHEALLRDKLAQECSSWLVRAQWFQDVAHQIHSNAHFDNCAFEETFVNINSILGEASKHVEEKNRRQAVFALGQILHVIQDFYAHTNYVEIMAQRHPSDLKQVKWVELWDKGGQDIVRAMIKNDNLISGYVSWGEPKLCAWKEPSHHTLNKDGPDTTAGARIVSGWSINQHQAARQLADGASLQFLRYAIARWPFLKEACGKSGAIAYYSNNDRRNMK